MAVINIIDFGAKTGCICTEAIQKAIDACGYGDTVRIPSGKYISGALFIKGNMKLFLDDGAILAGSTKLSDYPVFRYGFEGLEQDCYASLINTADGAHSDIEIYGKGVIDASGAALCRSELDEKKGARGRAVCIRNTDGLKISDVTIRQSPSWCLHLLYCKNVTIENVRIHTKYDENGEKYPGIFNGDGIDVDSCSNVVISNSYIESQDDCIAIKSGRDEEGRRVGIPTENVLIQNCSFYSGFGVAVGSEMSAGVRNVTVRDCSFENSFSIASIKAPRGRGGNISDIVYENCTLVNKDESLKDCRWFRGALYVDCFYGCEKFDAFEPCAANDGTPVIDKIYFRNIELSTVGGNGVYFCGLPEQPIKSIYMENIKSKGVTPFVCMNVENLVLKNTTLL